jgi:hypothetical protein
MSPEYQLHPRNPFNPQFQHLESLVYPHRCDHLFKLLEKDEPWTRMNELIVEIDAWLCASCVGKWKWSAETVSLDFAPIHSDTRYSTSIFFTDAIDLVAFKLRWGI